MDRVNINLTTLCYHMFVMRNLALDPEKQASTLAKPASNTGQKMKQKNN